METLSQYLAKHLLNGTRKKFSSLMADYIQEQAIMATPTASPSNAPALKNNAVGTPADGQKPVSANPSTSSMGVSSQVGPIIVKPVGNKTLEGSYPGDHRDIESADFSTDSFKSEAGPRGETGTKGA